MARIRWVEESEARGEVGRVYEAWRAKNPGRDKIPEILKALSPNPQLLSGIVDLVYPVHFQDGHLTRRTKEAIATFVSGINRCPY